MSLELMISNLDNRLSILDTKKRMYGDAGNSRLSEVFGKEYDDTLLDLQMLRNDFQPTKRKITKEIEDKFKAYLLENLPNLMFYFRKKSIQKAISDSIDKTFERMNEERK
jgi:hypothetical protein